MSWAGVREIAFWSVVGIATAAFIVFGVHVADSADERNYKEYQQQFTHRCNLLGGVPDMPDSDTWVCIKDEKVIWHD